MWVCLEEEKDIMFKCGLTSGVSLWMEALKKSWKMGKRWIRREWKCCRGRQERKLRFKLRK